MDNQLLTPEEQCYLAELEQRGEVERALLEGNALVKKRLDLKSVLESDAGQAVIWSIISSCGIFNCNMTGNSQTYFREGRRSIGLELMAEVIAANPNVWIEMQRERMIEIQQTLTESEQ